MSSIHVQELDSWYFKFKHLLFSGYDANLQLISKNGKATVILSAELGAVSKCKANKKARGPSYYKRLDKRKEQRRHAAANLNESRAEIATAENSNDDISAAVEAVPPPVILCDNAAEEAFSNVVDDGQTQPIEENITAAAEEATESSKVEETKELAAEATTDKEDVAAKQTKKLKRWFCDFHGCVVEHRKEAVCTCCGDRCVGVAYSDDEYDDPLDPP